MNGDAGLQFQQAIQLAPDNAEAHYYLAELYYGMNPKRLVAAIDEYEQTVQLAPDSFIAQRAQERLIELGVATPEASLSPAA